MKRWHRAARRLHAHSNAHTHTHNANAREEVYSLLRCAERMTKYTHTHTHTQVAPRGASVGSCGNKHASMGAGGAYIHIVYVVLHSVHT